MVGVLAELQYVPRSEYALEGLSTSLCNRYIPLSRGVLQRFQAQLEYDPVALQGERLSDLVSR